MDVTDWIGDWMYDATKLKALSEERAIQDIIMMDLSPDYDGDAVLTGIKLASEQLGMDRLDLIASMLVHDADQMSKV